MQTTSVSLLHRLSTDQKEVAWRRFVQIYAPLIHHWILRAGVSTADAADCAQEVFSTLVVKLPSFTYDANRSFRAWLRTVTTNKCRDLLRRNAAANRTVALQPAHSVVTSEAELISEEEYRRALVHRALAIMRAEFEPLTYQACWEHIVSGDSAATIACRLGISENAVYLAKSRVLRRLRQELDGLLD